MNPVFSYIYQHPLFTEEDLKKLSEARGSSIVKAIMRIIIWGTIVMILSALVGYLFGVNVA